MAKSQVDVADIRELLQGSTQQMRLLVSGKGDVTVANAVATQVRSHVSLMNLAIKMHKMGARQNVLGLPAEKVAD